MKFCEALCNEESVNMKALKIKYMYLNFLQKSGQISLALCCDFKFVNNKLIKF